MVSLGILVLNSLCRFDSTLWATGYIIKIIVLIISLIFFFQGSLSLSSVGVFVAKVTLILGGILLTRQVADNIMRKELYKYYFADFHLDCSLCLVPVLIHFLPVF